MIGRERGEELEGEGGGEREKERERGREGGEEIRALSFLLIICILTL